MTALKHEFKKLKDSEAQSQIIIKQLYSKIENYPAHH
jgi:hypothetical protein